MKKKLTLLFLLLLLLSPRALCAPQARAVVRDTVCHVSKARMQEVVDLFALQFQSCPDSLFSWAYLNTDSRDGKSTKVDTKGKDAIILVYKDRSYDSVTRFGDVALDIYVLGVRLFRDNHLGSVYITANQSQQSIGQLTATYSGSLLEGGNIIFRMEEAGEGMLKVNYRFELTFGKYFSGFITNRTWNNVAEWRISRIFDNIIEYAVTGKVEKM